MNLDDPFNLVGSIVDGRYRVDRVAGKGGFSVVYCAFHLSFESRIALKVLKVPGGLSPEKVKARFARFQREGRVVFGLSSLHPCIVKALETGIITSRHGERLPYLALEWLDGVSLDRELKYRRQHGVDPMTLPEVIALLHEPARALAMAHARNVVHRDIKPGNLFISFREGVPLVKILDFGIAKILDDSNSVTAQFETTGSAPSSFTPMYAAPEQWLPRLGATGPSTDVHAWALLCLELLTGKSPIKGDEPAQIMAACLDATLRPTPRTLGIEVEPEVEKVFARAVALNPRERFVDVGEFWDALRAAAQCGPGQVSRSVAPHIFAPEHVDEAASTVEVTALDNSVRKDGAGIERSRTKATAPTEAPSLELLRTTPNARRVGALVGGSVAGLGLLALLISQVWTPSARIDQRVDPSRIGAASQLHAGEPAAGTTPLAAGTEVVKALGSSEPATGPRPLRGAFDGSREARKGSANGKSIRPMATALPLQSSPPAVVGSPLNAGVGPARSGPGTIDQLINGEELVYRR